MYTLNKKQVEFIDYMRPWLGPHLPHQAGQASGPPDVLSGPAMHNAYYICHNVQVAV